MSAVSPERVSVVIVDDCPDQREVLQQLLELDGYTAYTAADALEAMPLIETHRPECVILDLLMPQVSGVELMRWIRERQGPDGVIIVLTGSSDPQRRREAEDAGADYVMLKPLDSRLLARMLPPVHRSSAA